MRIGAHVSVAGGVQNAVDRELEFGGNCGQIFTHSPQVWQDPTINDEEARSFVEETAEKLDGPWVIHTSYLVNLATPKDDLRQRSIDSVQRELNVAAKLDIDYVNTHLGAHTGAGEDGGLENVISAIDSLDIPADVTLLIESDAGSGTKLGGEFEHLSMVLEHAEPDLAVCLDTAHAFAAGYDLSSVDAVEETVDEFDSVVGLEHLACIHLNDSRHARGTNKDEHAHIGKGEIGEAGIQAILNHEDLRERPFVLETPTDDERGFAWNIERAKSLRQN